MSNKHIKNIRHKKKYTNKFQKYTNSDPDKSVPNSPCSTCGPRWCPRCPQGVPRGAQSHPKYQLLAIFHRFGLEGRVAIFEVSKHCACAEHFFSSAHGHGFGTSKAPTLESEFGMQSSILERHEAARIPGAAKGGPGRRPKSTYPLRSLRVLHAHLAPQVPPYRATRPPDSNPTPFTGSVSGRYGNPTSLKILLLLEALNHAQESP